jgi:pimeloyl-ACP methyl ester carboxylesterase
MSRFVPAHALVTAPAATPTRWMLMLHGLLGSGANWRSFARRLASAIPAWGFVLVDLRMHGESQDAPPPHTLDAAADDLVALRDAIARPIAGVLGHSFGGKVALAYAARARHELEQVWVLDASPGSRQGQASGAREVLQLLRRLPPRFPSREAFVEAVVGGGEERAIADWLAMNLRATEGGFRLQLDLEAVGALLESYVAADLWQVLERAEGAKAFHVVVAGRSDAFNREARARLAAIPSREPRVHEHILADSGHWVHVDAPEALFALLTHALG